jgi:hypothetical protein
MSMQSDSGKSSTGKGSSEKTPDLWEIETSEGESLGPFAEPTILRGLREGWLRPNDSARRGEQNRAVKSLVDNWYAGKYSVLLGLLGFFVGLAGGLVFAASRSGISLDTRGAAALLIALIVFIVVEVAIMMTLGPVGAGCLGAIGLIIFIIVAARVLMPALAPVIGSPEGEGFKAMVLFLFGPAWDFVLNKLFFVVLFFGGGAGAGYGLGYVLGRFLAKRRCDLKRLPRIRQPVPTDMKLSSEDPH